MTHKFEFVERHKLISEKRKKILPAKKILLDIGLKGGDIFADIGCGIGYFSLPASKIVGNQGKVYAMDISQDMLDEMKTNIYDKDITNIELIKTSEDNLVILDNIINVAFASTVLHEVDGLSSILNEIKRIMVNKGNFIIIEWNEVKKDLGPPIKHRIFPDELFKKLKKIGFHSINVKNMNEYFYIITCSK
ncbi:class I SAM-dependent methyltransferase [Actinomycetota bacterium]